MKDGDSANSMRIGLLRIREHCTFTWRQAEGETKRALEVRPHHCEHCLAEARRSGYVLRRPDGTDLT